MGPAVVDAERRRFDCIWDALTGAGRDPREDVACVARQIDSVVACTPGESRVEVCLARSRAVCALSTEYQRAARTCRGPRTL